MTTPTGRNYSIDSLRFLCALLVVIIHTRYFPLYAALEPFARAAVPCFFMISGYLMWDDHFGAHVRKSIPRVLWILFYSTLFYGVETFLKWKLGLMDFFISSYVSLADVLLLNANPFVDHLWYLQAYLYVLLIALLLDRGGKSRWLFWAPVLYLLGLVVGKYGYWTAFDFPVEYSRNFLFVGLPCFSIGMMLRAWRRKHGSKMSLGGVAMLLALATACSYVERMWLSSNELQSQGDFFLTTPLVAVLLLEFFLCLRQRQPNIFSKVGRRDALLIYVYHVLVLEMLFFVARHLLTLRAMDIYFWLAPFLAFFLTELCVVCYRRIFQRHERA